MEQLNLSGIISPKKTLDKVSFLKEIQKDTTIKNYKKKKTYHNNKKIKLGLDEFEFTFDMTINGQKVPVLIYLQLSIDGQTVEVIESFTGVNTFININQYKEQLTTLFKNTIKDPFHYKITIDAYSSQHH